MLQSGISYCIPPETETETETGDVGRKVRKDYQEKRGGEDGEQVEEQLIMLLHSSPSQKLIYLLEFNRIKVILTD